MNCAWAAAAAASISEGGVEEEGGRSMFIFISESRCAMRCVLPPRRSSSVGVKDARAPASGGLLLVR